MKIFCKILSTCIVMFFFTSPLSASAGAVNYPGVTCQKAITTDPDPAYSGGEIRNPDTSRPLMVECSVPKFDFNFNGIFHTAAIESAFIRVTEPTTGRSFCRLTAKARLNDGIMRTRIAPQNATSRFGGNLSQYNFGNMQPIDDNVGHYVVRCDIQAGHRLVMYRINE